MHRFISLVLLVVLAAPATALAAQETSEKKAPAEADRSKQIDRGDLTGNMQLLNLWGERPAAVQRLYEAAYQILAAKPDARHPYRVLVDGQPVHGAATGAIATSSADGQAKARISFGSCFHCWRLGNEQQAAALCQREPTALNGLRRHCLAGR